MTNYNIKVNNKTVKSNDSNKANINIEIKLPNDTIKMNNEGCQYEERFAWFALPLRQHPMARTSVYMHLSRKECTRFMYHTSLKIISRESPRTIIVRKTA